MKRLFIGISVTLLFAYYFHNRHMYDKEQFDRMNYLLQNKVPLSGVYLQQRHPFGFLWYVQWLLPYHQSLKINNRQVGLGRTHNETFNMESEFVLHKGGSYDSLNDMESSIPIECWVDYKRKFGHFPENIDIELLNKITLTREEASSEQLDNIYKATCGSLAKDIAGDWVFVSCRSTVMYAIREEELQRKDLFMTE